MQTWRTGEPLHTVGHPAPEGIGLLLRANASPTLVAYCVQERLPGGWHCQHSLLWDNVMHVRLPCWSCLGWQLNASSPFKVASPAECTIMHGQALQRPPIFYSPPLLSSYILCSAWCPCSLVAYTGCWHVWHSQAALKAILCRYVGQTSHIASCICTSYSGFLLMHLGVLYSD